MSRTMRKPQYIPRGKTAIREPRPAPRRTGTRAAVVAAARKEG